MRILFCDPLNTQNLFRTFVGYLRKEGIDCMVISPERLPYFLPFNNPVKYLRMLKELLDYAEGFGLIVCSGLSPMWFRFLKKPFIFYNYGSDLDQIPVQGWSGQPTKFNTVQRITHFLIKHAQASALRKASVVVLVPYQIEAARKLGLKRLHFLPAIIDTELFKPRDKEHEGLVFSHPTRQVWTDRTLSDCKGNDKVFRAFARFLTFKEAKLIAVEKGWDLEASKSLVKELGISDHVEWIAPVSREELSKLYNKSDIVLDQFEGGILSLIPIEAMACGTPVISYVKEATELFYPEMPPIINVKTEDDILHGMLTVKPDNKGRKWVEKYCSPEAAIPKYIELFNKY